MTKDKLVSPNEMMQSAKDIMLDGREPKTDNDWALIVNFWAANTLPSLAESLSLLMAKMYDCPLPDDYIKQIAKFQAKAK